jgi:hypothetical protein
MRWLPILAGFLLAASAQAAIAGGDCKFPPSKPVVLKGMGPCNFDPASLSFAGTSREQAACLVSPVAQFGTIGTPRTDLPATFSDFVGNAKNLPDREALRRVLRERGVEQDFAPDLSNPVARALDDDPLARPANYFVIHDTSSPNFMGRAWPSNIDNDKSINNLGRYACDNKIERAHVFINRGGAIMLAHDFSVPWRATKFEMAREFGTTLRGLFLHVELIQPRKRAPGRGWANDFLAPDPGFSQAQYDALALVYTVASVRAGYWLIPAFHAVLDDGIYDKHDDPQNFDLAAFAASIDAVRDSVRRLAAEQTAAAER